jgi:hypothetical protein
MEKKFFEWGRLILIIMIILLFAYLDLWYLPFVAIIIMIIYKIYRSKEYIKQSFTTIEIMLWGRPLEKQYWTKRTWKNRPRFEILPKQVSTTINMPFRFAFYMFIFSLGMFLINWKFDMKHTSTFSSLVYILGIFALLFILIQLSTALRIYYENKRTKQTGKTNIR